MSRMKRLQQCGNSLCFMVVSSLVLGAPALAQAIFSSNQELPTMVVRICPSLDDAIAQARASLEFGKLEFSEPKRRAATLPKCGLIKARITPLRPEEYIPAFSTWMNTYDKYAKGEMQFMFEGKPGAVRVSVQLQAVRYYYSAYKSPDGKVLMGWAEISSHPPVLEFLREQGRWP